jgi:hypothetical protein
VAGSLRKQGVGINAIVQQNQEFSIQNEDFPALPGYKGVHLYGPSYLSRFINVLSKICMSGTVSIVGSFLAVLLPLKAIMEGPKTLL